MRPVGDSREPPNCHSWYRKLPRISPWTQSGSKAKFDGLIRGWAYTRVSLYMA